MDTPRKVADLPKRDTPRTDEIWTAIDAGMLPLNHPLITMLLHARTLERELAQANARLAEVGKDAERFDWIDKHKLSTGHSGGGIFPASDHFEFTVPGDYSTLRAAIDAQMDAWCEKYGHVGVNFGELQAAIDAAITQKGAKS